MEAQIKKCQNCKADFTIESEDFNFYKKINVPLPSWCSLCRMIRRMSWRNERGLHKAVCDLCKKGMVSMYDPKNNLKVYCDKCWWGDGWDGLDYQIPYDFKVPFFIQWSNLLKKIPLIQAWRFNNVNSDYVNYATEDKNCYLSSSTTFSENVFYSYAVDKSQDILDSIFINKSNWCYENIDSQNNYNSIFLVNCSDCIDSQFLFDCVNCKNCFLSSNLRNKKYVFKNQQYSKEEYESKIIGIKMDNFFTLEDLKLEFFRETKAKAIHKFAHMVNVVNTSGDNVEDSKNVQKSFNIYNSENSKYVVRAANCKDSMDVIGTINTELAYESIAPSFKGSSAQFSMTNQTSRNIRYSFLCSNSSNLFACIGLRNKSYCILNKQYTKKEYEELVPKIVKHMDDMPYIDSKGRIYKYGEFFPPELSPFCYNETISAEYFPLTKEKVKEQGYKWKEKEIRNYTIDIKTENIPNNIKDVDESILGKVIECAHKGTCNEQCTEAFKIIGDELKFYQKMNLPIPHYCPNCRHYARLAQRNPLRLWHRHCMKEGCTNEFETSYAPNLPEVVYCEKCYQQEVY